MLNENIISSFKGENFYLSNFYPCEILFEEINFPSSEHIYVAQKTLDLEIRKKIALVEGAGKVKRIGRSLVLRDDWDDVKLDIMKKIINAKFDQNPDIKEKLINTKDSLLIEGNYWGDTYWGQCPIGKGQNNLGKILMEYRDRHSSFNNISSFFE
jgi:ribA/ribD-fused uncharacterized protein